MNLPQQFVLRHVDDQAPALVLFSGPSPPSGRTEKRGQVLGLLREIFREFLRQPDAQQLAQVPEAPRQRTVVEPAQIAEQLPEIELLARVKEDLGGSFDAAY